MKTYQERKEQARNEAIFWQLEFSEHNYSMEELAEFGKHFEQVGKRYGLTVEFRENGII